MTSFLSSWLTAQNGAEAEATGGLAALLFSMSPFLVMLAVFYFFIMRPQQQQQKERNMMLSALEKGDKVVTSGGIYGEIVELREDTVILKVADKVQLKMTRGSISKVID